MRVNLPFYDDKTYQVNYQTCVVANEMRRRGFNVESLANSKGSALEKLSYNTESIWLDSNGNHPRYNISGYILTPKKLPSGNTVLVWEQICKTRKQLIPTLESDITEDGRYIIKWSWANKKYGHTIILERINGRYRYYDPQNGKVIDDKISYFKGMKVKGGIEWLRVDNLLIDADAVKQVLTITD